MVTFLGSDGVKAASCRYKRQDVRDDSWRLDCEAEVSCRDRRRAGGSGECVCGVGGITSLSHSSQLKGSALGPVSVGFKTFILYFQTLIETAWVTITDVRSLLIYTTFQKFGVT